MLGLGESGGSELSESEPELELELLLVCALATTM
jgi:hypothetical protein